MRSFRNSVNLQMCPDGQMRPSSELKFVLKLERHETLWWHLVAISIRNTLSNYFAWMTACDESPPKTSSGYTCCTLDMWNLLDYCSANPDDVLLLFKWYTSIVSFDFKVLNVNIFHPNSLGNIVQWIIFLSFGLDSSTLVWPTLTTSH